MTGEQEHGDTITADKDGHKDKKHQCDQCHYNTAYSSNLIKHKRRHNNTADHRPEQGTPNYSCRKCKDTFETQEQYHHHQQQMHRPDRHTAPVDYSALNGDDDDDNDTDKDRDKDKQVIDKKKKIKCKDCDYRCAYKSTMKQHEQKHLQKNGKPVSCPKCDLQCPTNRDLKKHMLVHEEVKHFGCDQCEFVCSNFPDLIFHKRIHDDDEEVRRAVLDAECLPEEYDSDDDRQMDICDMLKIEIREDDRELIPPAVEEEDGDENCVREEEESREDDEDNYEMVMNEEKNGLKTKSFLCKLCGYSCRYLSGMKLHQQRHSGVKLYQCDECSYRCSYSSSLTKHKRTHTGEKPYECDQCEAKFARTDHLKNHKITHTHKKKAKPQAAVSDIVQELIKMKDISLTKIIKPEPDAQEEKRFQCDECEYSCDYLSSLKLHQQRHSGIKLYHCDLCSYKCAYSSSLTKHRRTHTGEKPYECPHCGNRFARGDHLKAHIQSHLRPKSKLNRKQRQIQESNEEYSNVLSKLLKNNVKVYRFQCDSCEFRCTYPQELADHNKVHLGEDILYKCNRCQFTCPSASQITKHRKLVHGDGKCYTCNKCDYKTTHSGNFNKHRRVHLKYAQTPASLKGFKCDKCPFSCLRGDLLKKHQTVHTGYSDFYDTQKYADSEPDFDYGDEPVQESPLDFSLSS